MNQSFATVIRFISSVVALHRGPHLTLNCVRLVLAFVAFCIIPAPFCSSQEVLANQLDLLHELVEKLSSDKFLVREEATERLAVEFDESMLAQMDAIAKTQTDLEARVRLSGIIRRIKEDRLQNQIKGFIRSRDPNETFGFEGWRSFSRYSGVNRSAKLLFLKLLDDYPDLVEKQLETKQTAADRSKLIATAIGKNTGENQQSEVADGLALLYCINASEEFYDSRLERISLFTFRIAPFGPFLVEPQFRNPLEQLMYGWASRVKQVGQGCLLLFMEKNMPHARDIALTLLDSKEAIEDKDCYLLAMHALYRFGQREDLPMVEKWLDDKTVCYERESMPFLVAPGNFDNGNAQTPLTLEKHTIECRDAALLIAMRLAGEDPHDTFERLRNHENYGFFDESILLPESASQRRLQRIADWRKKRTSK